MQPEIWLPMRLLVSREVTEQSNRKKPNYVSYWGRERECHRWSGLYYRVLQKHAVKFRLTPSLESLDAGHVFHPNGKKQRLAKRTDQRRCLQHRTVEYLSMYWDQLPGQSRCHPVTDVVNSASASTPSQEHNRADWGEQYPLTGEHATDRAVSRITASY